MATLKAKLAQAETTPFWAATAPPGVECPALTTDVSCDLAIIGGGFTGLWSALKARERYPDAQIIVVEAGLCGQEASGRNGGFCAPSVSHGVSNALTRWPRDAETLIRLGRENLDALAQDLDRLEIDAEFERSGKLNVAATPWQAEGLRAMARDYTRFGIECTLLERAALKDKLDSPSYTAGLFEPNYALVNPARLVAGLRRVCLAQGITISERTQVTALAHKTTEITLRTANAKVIAKQVVMATNAARPLLKRLRAAIIPIYDYTVLTQPLSDAQLASIGWSDRYGIADSGNQFHYFRKTKDNRILWGGYDAIYHYGSNRDAGLLHRPESFERLAQQFGDCFPQLGDVRFDHAWGGIIDTSARTTFFSGTAFGGKLAYAMGFTGQGVSASRFAALTMLDLLDGLRTERSELAMLRRRPVPFPPEPLRSLAVQMAQKELAHEDKTGHRLLLLRTLDAFGVGFGS